MSRKSLSLLLAILVVALVAGCTTVAPAPSPVPATKTPKPTFTPTPDWTPTSIAFETAAPAPATAAPEATAEQGEATAEPEATADETAGATAEATAEATEEATAEATEATPLEARLTATQNVNVRTGPGTVYPAIGRLSAGDSYPIAGRNEAGDWLQFEYNGRMGWVTAALVSVQGDAETVKVAQAPAIPTPRPQPTAAPRPTNPPAPPAQPTNPPPPPVAQKHWMLVQGSPKGSPQCGTPYFKGQVQFKNGTPQNGVCLLLDRYGPRTIKYSGSDGAAGNWGFTPCGEENCGQIKIYVVQCPPGVDAAGMSLTPGMAVPPAESDVFEINMTDKCQVGQWENIIFRNTVE